jgi:hypothetical protein
MGITPDSARHLINRTLRTAENRAVEEMRELENARLDLRPGRNLVQRAGRGQPGRDGFPADQPALGQTERSGLPSLCPVRHGLQRRPHTSQDLGPSGDRAGRPGPPRRVRGLADGRHPGVTLLYALPANPEYCRLTCLHCAFGSTAVRVDRPA